MNYEWKMDLSPRSGTTAATLPPPLIEETAWDILLALHSDEECELGLGKLACVASVQRPVLNHWLALLEERQLITGTTHGLAQGLRAVLTPSCRELIDRYLSVASDLQIAAHD